MRIRMTRWKKSDSNWHERAECEGTPSLHFSAAAGKKRKGIAPKRPVMGEVAGRLSDLTIFVERQIQKSEDPTQNYQRHRGWPAKKTHGKYMIEAGFAKKAIGLAIDEGSRGRHSAAGWERSMRIIKFSADRTLEFDDRESGAPCITRGADLMSRRAVQVWHVARSIRSWREAPSSGSYPYLRRSPQNGWKNKTDGARYLRNANSLRDLCGGRFYRFSEPMLAAAWDGARPHGPGWPASRLILARLRAREHVLRPSTDRVTTDTIMWLRLSMRAERWPRSWQKFARE